MVLCDYGCGLKAKYKFKNGINCCSPNHSQCPKIKAKIGKNVSGIKNGMFGKTHSRKVKELLRKKRTGSITSDKTKRKQREANLQERSYLWKGGYYSKGFPLFDTYNKKLSWAEKCRRNKKDKNILEVRCAYCGNWFIPSITQVYERVRTLNGKQSGDQRFYCLDRCKQECPIYNQKKYPKGFKLVTSREVQPELRQLRFEIDNYTCQRCKKYQGELDVALHCHHIEGIRWEALESADLDKVITLCKTCHIEVHKIEGCGYHDLQCKEE